VRRALFCVALLTLVYALVLASFHPWDLAIGAALSCALFLAARGYLFGDKPDAPWSALGRVAAFVPFAAAVVRDVLVGTWEVALVTLHLRPLDRPGIVAVPIGERTPTGIAVTALVMTLSPGEFLVEVDWERRAMLMHVIDASNPEKVRAAHERFYSRYQRKVFP
jgi:multisubunit Na+/H+ antiporter MnhE subunit